MGRRKPWLCDPAYLIWVPSPHGSLFPKFFGALFLNSCRLSFGSPPNPFQPIDPAFAAHLSAASTHVCRPLGVQKLTNRRFGRGESAPPPDPPSRVSTSAAQAAAPTYGAFAMYGLIRFGVR